VCEREESAASATFIEHMLFKGTETLKVGSSDRMIKAAGGYNNAHTRYESTDFIDILPSTSCPSPCAPWPTPQAQHLRRRGTGRERLVVLRS